MNIPVILEVAWVLAVSARTSHIVIYVPGDSRTCRLQATRIILGIKSDIFLVRNRGEHKKWSVI
ncbi:hypothetical protein C9426_31200 [Serratia sp. S1B]|nr:hypothetical protein C9426_31200 [Serratia sp. S1B]